MKNFLHTLLRRGQKPNHYAVPAGERVYAIGDIHGRLDLFRSLLNAIESDESKRQPAHTTIILLGDLIDRGPQSAGVIDETLRLRATRQVRILMGNHEELFLEGLEKEDVLRQFLRVGGKETVLSYPFDPEGYLKLTLRELQEQMRAVIPAEHIDFIRSFEDYIQIGDYLFVHAGIRPGVEIGDQSVKDLRWIRAPFLQDDAQRPICVVHGHSITEEPELKRSRIGLDTGAYRSGKLTALGLEGQAHWLLQTEVYA